MKTLTLAQLFTQAEKFLKKGKYLKALSIYRKVLQRPDSDWPDLELAFSGAGEGYFNLQILAEAEDYFRQAIRLNPFEARYHYFLGLTLTRMSRFREAVFELKLAKQVLPKNPEILRSLGWAMFFMGNPLAGERTLKQALEINPKDVLTYCDLAVIYINNYEYRKAEQAIATAEKLSPQDPLVKNVKLACRSFRKIGRDLKSLRSTSLSSSFPSEVSFSSR